MRRNDDKPMSEARLERERLLDESLEETFPASDPVSMQQMLIVGRARRPFHAGTPRLKTDETS